jgi:hypothetical protein
MELSVMSDLDALLRKYRDRTSCNPPDATEIRVLTHIRASGAASPLPLMFQPAFRPAAMLAGLFIGIAFAGLAPVLTPNHAAPDLSVFAADSSYLASSWLNLNQ